MDFTIFGRWFSGVDGKEREIKMIACSSKVNNIYINFCSTNDHHYHNKVFYLVLYFFLDFTPTHMYAGIHASVYVTQQEVLSKKKVNPVFRIVISVLKNLP